MILRVVTALEKHGDGIGICGCGSDGDYGDWVANSRVHKQGFRW